MWTCGSRLSLPRKSAGWQKRKEVESARDAVDSSRATLSKVTRLTIFRRRDRLFAPTEGWHQRRALLFTRGRRQKCAPFLRGVCRGVASAFAQADFIGLEGFSFDFLMVERA